MTCYSPIQDDEMTYEFSREEEHLGVRKQLHGLRGRAHDAGHSSRVEEPEVTKIQAAK